MTTAHTGVSSTTPMLATQDLAATYCYAHPMIETGVTCVQCGRSICAKCMSYAPVGQLCKPCAQQRQPAQYQVKGIHYIVGAIAASTCGFGLAVLAAAMIIPLPIYSIWLTLLLTVPAKQLAVRLLDAVTRGRRGKRFQVLVGVGLVVGSLPAIGLALLGLWIIEALMLGLFIGVVAYQTMISLR